MKVGYARVSTINQSLDIQIDKLKEYGCEKIFTDKSSGIDSTRNGLTEARRFIREGDIFVVTKLDRLARSTFHLTQIAQELESLSIDFVVLDQSIDTTNYIGKLLFNILGAFAEFEHAIRKERQLEGIAKAKEEGVRFGAKNKLTDIQIEDMRIERESGVLIRDLMEKYNISKATVYRLL